MTNPQPYQVNNDGYGQPVYAVNEPGPGVTVGMHVSEYGQQAYLVSEPGRGAQPVWFENGPPPGSLEWVNQQVMAEQQQYAAWSAANTHAAVQHAQLSSDAHLLQQS